MGNENIIQDATLAERVLPIGTVLSGDQFTITDQLGAGGFGITYRAKDNVLGRTVVIKECFPEDFCVRHGKNVVARSETYVKPVRSIVRMFMREAQSLAKLRHPNIVGVHRAFEENETAYMALDLIDGRDLFDVVIRDAVALSPTRVQSILVQMLDAIEEVHKLGLLHRDISPDNIIIEKNGTPVLIDFGAARADSSQHTRAVSSLLVVKDGYSPQEFYAAGTAQSPSSDLYALAATFYHVLNGTAPANSQARMIEIVGNRPDPCIPLEGRIEGYSPEFLRAIDCAMKIHPNDRLQSAAKWKSLISDAENDDKSTPIPNARAGGGDISLELELSLTKLVEETNVEVRRTSQIPVEKKEVAVTPKEQQKPDWVKEFNQGSFVQANAEPECEVDDEFFEVWDEDEELQHSDADQSSNNDKQRSETNWIDRAKEKQERIRSRQEADFAMFEARECGETTVAPSTALGFSDDLADGAVTSGLAPKEDIKSIRFLVVLLICFVFAAFLQIR